MDISKETIIRLASEAGLSVEGIKKLGRDLSIFAEGQAQKRGLSGSFPTYSGNGTFNLPKITCGDQHHDVTGNLSEGAQDKLAQGHCYASS